MAGSFCIGVDVGGTKISAALFRSDGTMFSRRKVATDRTGPEGPARQIADATAELMAAAADLAPRRPGSRAAARRSVEAIGVAVPGAVLEPDGAVWAPNIPGWDRFPLAERLTGRNALPLVLDSDRSAYVLGEQWCGAARGLSNVVFVAFGTGIGAGILVDGQPLRGSGGVAGAVGWFALDPRFRSEYGQRGCFECEASGTAIRDAVIRAIESGRSSMLATAGDRQEVRAEAVFQAAERGDPLSVEVLDRVAEYMAMGIANIVSILDPEMVVLGGGLFQSDLRLLAEVRSRVSRWAQPLAARSVRIEASGLGEDAGLCGAAKLAWDHVQGRP